jgi:hypothetical protein
LKQQQQQQQQQKDRLFTLEDRKESEIKIRKKNREQRINV